MVGYMFSDFELIPNKLLTTENFVHVYAGTVLGLGWWRGEMKTLWYKGDSLDQIPVDSSVRSPTE